MNERIIALDIGDRRIGIAVSDLLGITAQPVETYTRVGYGPDVRHISEIAKRYDTKRILSGLPRNMDGTEGFQVEKVKAFCAQLEAAGFEIEYYDERLTTVLAEGALLEGDLSREQRKKRVDMVAACMILESYLASGAHGAKAASEDEAEEEDGEDGILEMEDEDGNSVRFILTAHIDYRGERYVLVSAEQDTPDFSAGESFIMQAVVDEDGNDCYQPLDDEKLIEDVYRVYLEENEQ